MEGLARVADMRGEHDRAVELVAQAADLRRASTRPAPPYERADLRRQLSERAVVLLGPELEHAGS
jgi:hypothetical protein